MTKILLTDIQDRTLAMVEDEYFGFKTIRPVLGTFYERDVSFREISSIEDRFAVLGFARWRVRRDGRFYYRKRASHAVQHNGSAELISTVAGNAYLQLPRHVTQHCVRVCLSSGAETT